jgi:hypothetical protein
LLVILAVAAGGIKAHDIPADVTVHVLAKPGGQRLRVLIRVPLRAMRDVEFPEFDGGYLDLDRLQPLLPDAATLWITNFLDVREGDRMAGKPTLAATQIAVESDRSFASFDEAVAHLTGPRLQNSAHLVWNQVWFDMLLEYPIGSPESRFAIHPRFAHLAAEVRTVLGWVREDGAVRAFEFRGDPGMTTIDPGWGQTARRFTVLGFAHILEGADHLLFLGCLVIPFRRLRPLIWVVTAFTLAHSLTLLASAYDLAPGALWFPPLIETLIAVSIVYMALENIAGAHALPRRWMMALGFGLVHGFGFSFALRETLQFAGSHLLTSLVAFNLGVELGQLLVLALLAPALNLLFRYVVAERMGIVILSALVAHTGWHWMIDRAGDLSRYPFQWPEWNRAALAALLWWLMWIVIAAAALWAFRVRGTSGSGAPLR